MPFFPKSVYAADEENQGIVLQQGSSEQVRPGDSVNTNAPEATRIWKKTAIAGGAGVLFLIGAAGFGGAVYIFALNSELASIVNPAQQIASEISYELRVLCRSQSENWKPVCALANTTECVTKDRFYFNGSETETIQWTADRCGTWTNLNHFGANPEEVSELISKLVPGLNLANSQIADLTSAQIEQAAGLKNITGMDLLKIQDSDLSYQFARCPNYADYQNFVNSPARQACDQLNNVYDFLNKNQGVIAAQYLGVSLGLIFLAASGVITGVWVIR